MSACGLECQQSHQSCLSPPLLVDANRPEAPCTAAHTVRSRSERVQRGGASSGTVRALAQNIAETLQWQSISAAGQRRVAGLETVDLDSLGIKLKTLLLVGEEFLDVLALIALELDHLAHLGVVDDGSIAGELLLDHLENLLLVKLLRQTLDSGQGLASITLLDAYMNVILRLLYFSYVVNIDEGVVGLEVFDGHKLGVTGLLVGKGY